MRFILLLLLSQISTLSLAQDSLDLLFRAYSAEGRALQGSQMSHAGHWVLQSDDDPWQTVRISVNGHEGHLQLIHGKDSLKLNIDIHPSKIEQIQSLIIPRLQFGKQERVIKVNHLTCSWQGSMATALDYQYINPLEKQMLILMSGSCITDSLSESRTAVHVISDSVMLIRCGKEQGVLIKYYMDSDGYLTVMPAHTDCHEFDNPMESLTYRFLLLEKGAMKIEFDAYDVRLIRQRCTLNMRMKF